MQESSSNLWIANQTRKLRFGTNTCTKTFIVFSWYWQVNNCNSWFLFIFYFIYARGVCLEKCRKCSRRSFQYVMLSLRLLNVRWFFLCSLYFHQQENGNILNMEKQKKSYAVLFLMSPHLLPSIYDIALQPSIRPILACYRKLWSLILAFLRLIYTIFRFIIKKFHE